MDVVFKVLALWGQIDQVSAIIEHDLCHGRNLATMVAGNMRGIA